MKFFAVAVVVLASACAAQVPEGATQASPALVAEASAAWTAAGLPDVSECQIQPWISVDFAAFRDECQRPSCAEPGATVAECAYACTITRGDATWSVYAGEVAEGTPGMYRMSYEEAVAHETFHVWADCVGMSDSEHAHAEIWTDAIASFKASQARKD